MGSDPGAPALSLRKVSKAFLAPDGSATSVVDVERFDVARGEQVGLRGASGSGKTTLLHLIAGILQPDAGEILVAGGDVAAMGEADRDRWRAAHVGYVFQSFHLLSGYSALENVALAMHFAGRRDLERARHLLERVGLADRLHHRPRQLSVGQQQRVAVARALANAPELVLADEPTGNLDRRRAQEALALIREACRESGAALLFVSHDERMLAGFERRVELEELNSRGAPA
jgi:putative ABC transport system ATP-binding protein